MKWLIPSPDAPPLCLEKSRVPGGVFHFGNYILDSRGLWRRWGAGIICIASGFAVITTLNLSAGTGLGGLSSQCTVPFSKLLSIASLKARAGANKIELLDTIVTPSGWPPANMVFGKGNPGIWESSAWDIGIGMPAIFQRAFESATARSSAKLNPSDTSSRYQISTKGHLEK
jgi:hypothetical protein